MPRRGDFLDTGAMRLRVGRREVKISNPDKVFFPERGLKKIDLVEYYLDVGPCVLNHVHRRPMQMLRHPDGAGEWFFYQKRVPANHPDWLETAHIKFPSGRAADFPVCNDAACVAWIVNLGCIDLHTWHSRVTDVDRPDYLLIDLDPSEGNPWRHVRKIALVVKDVMDELGLKSFPKTSGSTGLHILAPIKPELGFPEVRRLAKAMAQEVERRIGDQRVATTTWKVASVRPERFTLTTMRKRIDEVGDLTKGMWRYKRSLVPLFSKLDLEPADPKKVDSGRRRGRVQRWESEQGGWQSRRAAQEQASRRAKK